MSPKIREQIELCTKELQEIELLLEGMSPFDKSTKYLTNYSLIRASGTIEFSMKSILADYFDKFDDERLSNYIDTSIRNCSSSAKYSNMCALLNKVDSCWKKEFVRNVATRNDKEKLIASADSLVTARHRFAHGKDVSISFQDIKNYYESDLELLEIYDRVIK